MSNEIPKPVKQRKPSPDRRTEFKNAWKRLFEEMYPGIVVHFENCSTLLDQHVSNKDVSFASNFYSPEIFVSLPPELGIDYLAGFIGNKMFSDVEVQKDEAYWQQNELSNGFDCEPETYTWKHFYYELCKKVEIIKKEIPKPPTP